MMFDLEMSAVLAQISQLQDHVDELLDEREQTYKVLDRLLLRISNLEDRLDLAEGAIREVIDA